MAAVTQIRNVDTAGYDYYRRKLADGIGRMAALRALKRKISAALYNQPTESATQETVPKPRDIRRALGCP